MEFAKVTPEEIILHEKLCETDFTAIFLVNVRQQDCIMKVHHGRGPRERWERKDREVDFHVMEVTAYARMKEKGLCDRGIVPFFFGSMPKFDPSLCQPRLRKYLRMFLQDDEYPPNALFIEYIPNMEMIDVHNYSEQRMNNLIRGLEEINKVLVLHGDVYPRNMMILKDDPHDRVVWIDFNRAQTYNEKTITARQRSNLEDEMQRIHRFKGYLAADAKKGELDQAIIYYGTSSS